MMIIILWLIVGPIFVIDVHVLLLLILLMCDVIFVSLGYAYLLPQRRGKVHQMNSVNQIPLITLGDYLMKKLKG